MKYSTICLDLDGTLLYNKNDVSDFTVSVLSQLRSKIQILLVSARMPIGMTYIQKKLGILNEPIVCYNGSLIKHGPRTIFSSTIDIAHVKDVHRIIQKYDAYIGLYHQNEWYVPGLNAFVRYEIFCTRTHPAYQKTEMTIRYLENKNVGPHKMMVMIGKKKEATLYKALHSEVGSFLQIYRSGEELLELTNRSVSKLSAIKILLQDDQTLENAMAFGDNHNDIDMLKGVGYGLAMANAPKEVKDAADQIIGTNTRDGVAHFLKNLYENDVTSPENRTVEN